MFFPKQPLKKTSEWKKCLNSDKKWERNPHVHLYKNDMEMLAWTLFSRDKCISRFRMCRVKPYLLLASKCQQLNWILQFYNFVFTKKSLVNVEKLRCTNCFIIVVKWHGHLSRLFWSLIINDHTWVLVIILWKPVILTKSMPWNSKHIFEKYFLQNRSIL